MAGLGNAMTLEARKFCFGVSVSNLRSRMSRESKTTDILEYLINLSGVCFSEHEGRQKDVRWANDRV